MHTEALCATVRDADQYYGYQSGIQIPWLTASAANASGFLQVSLSKMPRTGLLVCAPASCAEAFPIKASDYTPKWTRFGKRYAVRSIEIP